LERSREEMVQRTLTALLERFGADRAALKLEPDRVWQRRADGPSSLELPHEVLEQAMASSATVSVPDASADPRLAGLDGLSARSVRAALCAPLHLSSGRGALYLETCAPLVDDAATRLAAFADW